MDNIKMGQFIADLRKSKHMTQKDLAGKLNISDKAVSKWERGLSCPDISLLSPLAEILGVSVSALLNGEEPDEESSDDVETSVDNALQYADKTVKKQKILLRNIFAAAFSAVCLVGIITCAICDLAISGKFTWSLFPISSAVFAWLVFFPMIKMQKNGILCGLISLSVLVVPYLYVLDVLVGSGSFMPIGVRMSVIGLVFLWALFFLFGKMKSKLLAGGISLLLAIPVMFIINLSLAKLLHTPQVDIWDIMAAGLIGISAGILFALHRKMKSHT